jgi:hypothetical protein
MNTITRKGNLKITKRKQYDEIRIKGNLTSDVDIISKRINIKGDIFTLKSVYCEHEINIKGEVSVDSINSSIMDIHGKVKCNTIQAKKLKIISSRNCSIHEIKGEVIEIKRSSNTVENKKLMAWIFKRFKLNLSYQVKENNSTFYVDKIKGQNIILTNIIANEVIGNEIILKEKCKIKSLIYTNSISIDNETVVESCKKG